MSAYRYSGELIIRLTILEEHVTRYRCLIVPTREIEPESAHVVIVGAALAHRGAIDSPESFDRAAHAALSFAADEDWPIEEYAASTDTGWHVGRTPEKAWPSP